jgi:hypothetical protein
VEPVWSDVCCRNPKNRVAYARAYPQWRWHLDEAFVKLNDKLCYLWRAVDHEGEVLEAVVTAKRDKAAALKFLKRFSVLASSRTCSREGSYMAHIAGMIFGAVTARPLEDRSRPIMREDD